MRVRTLVYGGAGALGNAIVKEITASMPQAFVVNLDFKSNPNADVSITIRDKDPWNIQLAQIDEELINQRDISSRLDCIINVAGGFIPNDNSIGNVEQNWKLNTQPAYSSFRVAQKFLNPGGLLVLTGALGAFERGIPFAVGYGMSKEATHSLARSIHADKKALSPGSKIVCLLPNVLDTPANRAAMPSADYNEWSPLEMVAKTIVSWCKHPGSRPKDLFVRV